MSEKEKGIRIILKKQPYFFCPHSEILETNYIFCLREPRFCEESAKPIFKCKNNSLILPKKLKKRTFNLNRVKKTRVFKDKNGKKKLILNLIY